MGSGSTCSAGCTVEFQRMFRARSRASRGRQFLLFRNLNVTEQDVTGVIKLEYVRRLRRTSRVTLAFGILDDDAHGACLHCLCRGWGGTCSEPVEDQIFDPEHMAA